MSDALPPSDQLVLLDACCLINLFATGLIERILGALPYTFAVADIVARESLFVQLAADIDDGEAMTCALAVRRGYAVATDDRKTLRLLRERHPQVQILSTSSIVSGWIDAEQPSH